MLRRRTICFAALVILAMGVRPGAAQTSLTAALDSATRSSPRILLAEDDIRKAEAVLRESKDVYIPSIVANGGAGDSYGITLSVPTIVTVNSQSVVFSPAQRDYIRAARIQLQAATARAADVRAQVEEDTVVAYLDVDHAQTKLAILAEESGLAAKLLGTMQHRAAAGVATDLDVQRARRAAVEVKLEQLQGEDQLAFLRAHLAGLLGVAAAQLVILPSSIPGEAIFDVSGASFDPGTATTAALRDAESNAAASQIRAVGDKRTSRFPQVSFAAQYGRISPINAVTDFYNIHGEYNTFFGGVQFQFPLLDRVQHAHAEESAADAAHALHTVQNLRAEVGEEQLRSRHAVAELSAKAELAAIDLATAEDELQSALAQVQSGAAGRPLFTPVDEDRARLHALQLRLDALDAALELRKAEVGLLREVGELGGRLAVWRQGVTAGP